MALEDALRSLDDRSNENINWTIGSIVQQRAARNDWQECVLLQQLETGRNIKAWDDLFRRTRQALADENDLRHKALTLVQPDTNFDLTIDDFIAEMLAVLYLAELGHTNIRFLGEEDPIKTDLISTHNGITHVTEAKNLREPNTLTYVAFAHWHERSAARPDVYNFTAEFIKFENPFDDLTTAQADAVRRLIDELPNRRRPSTFELSLPGNRRLKVRVGEGAGTMLRHGEGPFLVRPVVEECQRAVMLKLLEPTRKALTQLYSTAVPSDYRRLLFVRWKPPDQVLAIGEADAVRNVIQNKFQTLIADIFSNFAIVILHVGEDVESTPKATWNSD